MPLPRAISTLLRAALALLTGCSSGPSLPALQLPIAEATTLPVSTAEAYARIAQGAMSCWFGSRGRLGLSHIFHADADPPSRGGSVEIVVHERAYDQPKPWGYKAFRITLKQGSEYTSIATENLRMPEPLARQMHSEVLAWARGSKGCTGDAVAQPGSRLLPTPVTTIEPGARN